MINEKIKVLICDDTADYGIKLASNLRENGFYAYTRKRDGLTLLKSLEREMPDVVVTDLNLPGIDALEIINHFKHFNGKMAEFIIKSDISGSYVERQAIDSGVACFITESISAEKLSSIIKSVVRKSISSECRDMEIVVTDIIRRLGIPAHVKGYHYLRTAILETLSDRNLMNSITKKLYPCVANRHQTTPTRVERAIRHAIDIAWNRGSGDAISDFFGYTIDMCKGKPTNSEFIALITDRLRLKYKCFITQEQFTYVA